MFKKSLRKDAKMPNSFKKICLILIALLTMPFFCEAKVIEFAQVSDVHYSLSNKEMDKYLHFLDLSIRRTAPEFVVFLGDNIDKSKEENVIGLMQAIRHLQSPYYLAFGTKDAHRISGIEKQTYLNIVSTFNKNQNNKNKYYYFKPNKDIICVVLDDSSDFIYSTHGEVSEEQLNWLKNLLDKNQKKLFLIFQHTPILEPRIEYKNSMLNADSYKELLKNYSNIVSISSGHYHQSAIQTDENGVRHISAPAFRDTPHSYQLIKVTYNKKSYKNSRETELSIKQINI